MLSESPRRASVNKPFSNSLGMVTGSDDNALWCCSHFALSQNWPGVEPITESPTLCGALTVDLAHSADTDMEAVCSGAHARRFAEPSSQPRHRNAELCNIALLLGRATRRQFALGRSRSLAGCLFYHRNFVASRRSAIRGPHFSPLDAMQGKRRPCEGQLATDCLAAADQWRRGCTNACVFEESTRAVRVGNLKRCAHRCGLLHSATLCSARGGERQELLCSSSRN